MTGFVSQVRVRALAVFAAVIACLGLSSIALALKPRAGGYTGKTSAGKKFEFKFRVNKSRTRVSRLFVVLRQKCNEPGYGGMIDYHLGAPGISAARIKHGRFAYSEDGHVIKGHFTSKRKAEGIVRQHQSYHDPYGAHVVCVQPQAGLGASVHS